MNEQKKVVTAFCHGPWVLISAGILKGKKATCYPGIKDDLKNAGAIYLDQPAVTDGNIITARHPKDVTGLMKAILIGLTRLPKFEAKSSINSRRTKSTARIKRRF